MPIFIFLFLLISGLNANLLDDYEALFKQLPNWNREQAIIEPFGDGCTNQNYKLSVGDKSYFVRIGSNPKTELGLLFSREVESIKLASKLGLTPPVLIYSDQILITPFVQSNTIDIHEPENLVKVIAMLKKVHESNEILSWDATPEAVIEKYLNILERLNIALTPIQQDVIANRPRPKIEKLVPCHIDVKGENVLDDGKKFWLIDWEYGGMSDPMFDLASLKPASGFNDEELQSALSLYIENPSLEQKQRFKQFCDLSYLCAGLWCLIMDKTSTLNHPYREWADIAFSELHTQINP